MPEEERLKINERFEVYEKCQRQYHRATTCSEKTKLLDSWVPVLGVHRKSLIRRLNGSCQRKVRQNQRQRDYGPEVDDALRVISEAHNHICAELLQPNLVSMAETLARHREMELTDKLREDLDSISISTVRRYLQRIYQDVPRRRRRPAGSTWQARNQIPVSRIPWSETEPGHFEIDLVHHCGPETRGEYVYSLQMIDVATAWVEPAALLGRSDRVMVDALTRCERRLPFPVLQAHSDNGSEFFTAHVSRYWEERAQVPHRSRSGLGRPNDNRFVEHRNGALIRAWIGRDRLDTAAQTIALNHIYDLIWRYHNFCQPVMRLIRKKRNPDTGRIRRFHDTPRTPYERLKASGVVPDLEERFESMRLQINPRTLRQEIVSAIAALFSLPMARTGVTEDIFQTLLPTEGEEDGVQ
jgi:hypothetical protein